MVKYSNIFHDFLIKSDNLGSETPIRLVDFAGRISSLHSIKDLGTRLGPTRTVEQGKADNDRSNI